MKEAGLWFGYGMEAYQARDNRADRWAKKRGEDMSHLVLLAKNEDGFRNLMRLSDEANRSGFHHVPRLDWALLEQYHEGVIATSACMSGLVTKGLKEGTEEYLNHYLSIFGFDDFLIEIHTYATDEQAEVNTALVSLAKERGLRLIYANDAHYARPEHHAIHEGLTVIQNHKDDRVVVLNDDGDVVDPFHPQCLYIMSEDDVRERLDYLPASAVDEAIESSDWLIDECSFELAKPTLHLPRFKTAEGVSGDEMLYGLVVDGLIERYGDEDGTLADEVVDRAEYEYNAICDAGLSDYFLIVHDFIAWAMHQGIMVGPGRGSVGGSILAYALDITTICPLKYNLQFERFWNPGRADGLPDIDVDFQRSRRQEVKDYLRRKYGEDRVLSIGTHTYMRPKAALDRARQALYGTGGPHGDLVMIKRAIDSTTDAGQAKPWSEMWEQLGEWAKQEDNPHPLADYRKRHPDLFDLAESLSGRIQSYGVHASAVVISDVDLQDQLPSRLSSKDETGGTNKMLVTQAEMKGVEKAGFPKFDLLGLRNLDTVMETATLSGEFGDPDDIETKRKIIRHFRSGHLPDGVKFNHLADSCWGQVDDGVTLGLFQIEEGNSARRIGKELKPRNIEDLAAIVALNRPGPLRSKDETGRNMVERYMARRYDKEETVFADSILEDILAPTYGDFLYQEQVIAYFRAIGYTLSDADHIRKMLGKKLVKEMQAERPKYIAMAETYMPRARAEGIWSLIEDFSKYSFNKAHAVGYGMILAWTMYAKWKWPTEFIMSSIKTDPERVGSYISEGRRLGVAVLPPDINRSGAYITKDGDEIFYGLVDVKNVGEAAAQWIIDNRPYKSYSDLKQKLDHASDEWKIADKSKRSLRSPKQTCTAGAVQSLYDAGAFDAIGGREEYSLTEKANFEEALLGITLTDIYVEALSKTENQQRISQCLPVTAIDSSDDVSVRVVGIIKSVKKTKTKPDARYNPDADMAHFTIEWDGISSERIAAFPSVYEDFKFMLKPGVLGEFTIQTGPKGAKMMKGRKLT